MKDFPEKVWFDARIVEQNREKICYNGLNLFAIWMKDCGIPDEPSPLHIDPRVWKGFHAYLYSWERLPKDEKDKWNNAAESIQ